VPWFRRRPDPPVLPLQMPRLDGTSWPERGAASRPSFATATLFQMGYREAFEPEAHDIAEEIVAEVLRRLALEADPVDEPYLRKACTTAARLGAGLGIVERRSGYADERSTDRRIAAALWQARRDLAGLPAPWQGAAAYLMQCGYYVARTHPATVPLLLDALERGDA
jgi:hypothetical protein